MAKMLMFTSGQMMATGMLSCDAGEYGANEGGGRRWLVGDYEAGDAVFHHACKLALINLA